MSHWWPPADEAAVDYAKRLAYIAEEYLRGDTYLLGRTTYELLWQGWSKDTTSNLGAILHRMNKYTALIDEYRFLVQSFIMGRGRQFFPQGMPPATVKLVESTMLSFGSLALVCQPVNK
jgi:dihydrofolate reductase